MSEAALKTGKVAEFDKAKQFGYIEYDEDEDMVYLPPDEAEGKGLKVGSEIEFTIRMNGSTPYATDVRLK